MPSSGGGRPHPRAQRPLRIATPPWFAAPPESANISTLRIATPLKKRVRQGRTGWAVGKRPCPASEPHVYLKYSPMYCGPSVEFRGPSATSGGLSGSFGGPSGGLVGSASENDRINGGPSATCGGASTRVGRKWTRPGPSLIWMESTSLPSNHTRPPLPPFSLTASTKKGERDPSLGKDLARSPDRPSSSPDTPCSPSSCPLGISSNPLLVFLDFTHEHN